MAQMSPEGSGRHELYELLRISGMTHLATIMVRLGVASVNDITLRQEELLTAGVHQWQLDRVLLADPGRDREAGVGEFRRDLPVQRPTHSRASLTAALVAAHPNNRRESLRLFEQDILANSTRPSAGPGKSRHFLLHWSPSGALGLRSRLVAIGALQSTSRPSWDTKLDTYTWQWRLYTVPPSRMQCGAFAEALAQLV